MAYNWRLVYLRYGVRQNDRRHHLGAHGECLWSVLREGIDLGCRMFYTPAVLVSVYDVV